MQRVERRMDRIAKREAELHELMAAAAEDYTRLSELDAEAKALASEREGLEEVWLEQAELVGE
jgi:ATP-binding cassette subfamily F protein uup